MQESGAAADARPGFTHSAFLYDTDATYGTVLAEFVRDGLSRNEAVAVAANARYTGLLRDALAGDAAEVRFLPAEEWYVRPVRTIAGWTRLLRGAAASGRPRRRTAHRPGSASSPH